MLALAMPQEARSLAVTGWRAAGMAGPRVAPGVRKPRSAARQEIDRRRLTTVRIRYT